MQDIDKIEKAIDGINETAKVGEKIMSDGKIDFADSQYIPELYSAVKKMIEAGKAYKELGEEIKDIDGVEAVKLIQKLFK